MLTSVMLNATGRTIVLPVSLSILNDLYGMINIELDTPTRVKRKGLEFQDNNWAIGKSESGVNTGPKHTYVEVEITTSRDNDNLHSFDTTSYNVPPFIHDQEIDLEVNPVYIDNEVQLAIKFLSKSESYLEMIKSHVDNLLMTDKHTRYHDVEYSYGMPDPVIDLLNSVNENKNFGMDMNVPLVDYVNSIRDDRVVVSGNISGNKSTNTLSVSEQQMYVIGSFLDVDLNTEIEQNEAYFGYEVGYTFMVNQPYKLKLKYPLSVYNRLLPKRHTNLIEHKNKSGYDPLSYARLGGTYDMYYNGQYINIPEFDRHFPIRPNPDTEILFSVMCVITKEDKKSLFNLKDFEDYDVNPVVTDALSDGEHIYVNELYNSVFNIELRESGKLYDRKLLKMDKDLNIFVEEDLDITKVYRLFFSICSDITVLKDGAKKRIKEYPNLYEKTLEILTLKNSGNVKGIPDRANLVSFVDKKDFPMSISWEHAVFSFRNK